MDINDHISKYFIKLSEKKKNIIIQNCNNNMYYRHFIKSIIKFKFKITKRNKLISKENLLEICNKYKINLISGFGSKIVKISKSYNDNSIDKIKTNYKQFNFNIKNLDKLIHIINLIYDENDFFEKIYSKKNKITPIIVNFNKNLQYKGNNTLSLKKIDLSDSESEFDINSIYIAEYSNK